jgi:predicted transcriptional regulator of viral defense system
MKWRDPDEARSRLFDIAQQQAGHFTARQALEAGYSRRLQHYHCSRGHWFRIDRALYRLKEFPPGKHEDLVRWTLWSGGKAVVSHESAAAVHELGDILPSRVHLTVPPGFRRRLPPGVIVHRDRLSDTDAQEGEGYRVTTPLRTIIDLMRSGTESDWLVGAIREALDRGAIRRPALDAEIARLDLAAQDRARRLLRHLEERTRAV